MTFLIPYAGQRPRKQPNPRRPPEPDWWQHAREMRSRGLSCGVIQRLLKRDHTSIVYATNDAFRERKRVKNRAYHRELRP